MKSARWAACVCPGPFRSRTFRTMSARPRRTARCPSQARVAIFRTPFAASIMVVTMRAPTLPVVRSDRRAPISKMLKPASGGNSRWHWSSACSNSNDNFRFRRVRKGIGPSRTLATESLAGWMSGGSRWHGPVQRQPSRHAPHRSINALPFGDDSAPYCTTLVASSWMASVRTSATFGEIST